MGMPESSTASSPPHLYPQTLQLKLYQAFIFSIPILFSIILFLLFYLFYLKRRISNASPTLPTRSTNHPSLHTPMSGGGLKGVIQKVKLPVIVFGEDSAMKESQCCCCICLGEFEEKEELHQLPPCTHIFHTQCITHWLRSNSTCPMCRSPVVVVTTAPNYPPPASPPAASSIPDISNDQNNATRHPRTNDDDQNEEHRTTDDGLLCRSDCGSREEEVVITINLQGSSSSSSSSNSL
ncbi:PREDICTED: probable E3 ubiquitin-protein ligase RHA4A [Ipomoea nil]|uniref:probable E3 ubiquitin-protein ligase RHA4A n=1 Tax=Ipomoea nil TaxID=35883 RepID=UPI00090169B4|nr:PREDICTED: probable E3 ubiquitin-protein ligase RHA4A [Ipomoea nil]